MDPQATWDRLLSAYAEGDWDKIEEAAGMLLGWLEQGGCPPKVTDRPSDLGPEWQRALASAGCHCALDMVQSRWRSKT